MKVDELKRVLNKSEKQSCSRFDLEEALMGMYRIADDLNLALDDEERKAVIRMHLLRTDHLFEVFENMIIQEKIL